MENKKLSFGYEDTDKKISFNLYGLDFEINNIESVEELEKLDRNDENVIEAQLEKILGIGAIDRINKKRVSDGYKELDLNIELGILGCIFEAYAKGTAGNVLGRVVNAVDDIEKDVKNYKNREQRRNEYKNFYDRNRGYIKNRRNRRY